MILADTSVLIDILRGELEASRAEKHGRIATCYLVEAELYKGTRLARQTTMGEKQVGKIVQRTGRLEATLDSARKFAELKQKYTDIDDIDLMIAGICISNESSIVTRDSDFQKIEELDTEII